ncbi:iron chelate uptake ABC transporter family permease subunit [Pelistega indica]|nr:iron chelate uptake ABC transporter family permease subunit [Pelistega indica]
MLKKFLGISIIAGILFLAIIFLFYDSDMDFNYIIPHRMLRLATIIVSGICIANSSIIFQTITNNHLLVPSVMGYEAIYLVWQSLLILLFGTASIPFLGSLGIFVSSTIIVLVYALALHKYIFPLCKGDMYTFLLFGFIISLVLITSSQIIQLSINPGEYSVLQGMIQTSFNRADITTLVITMTIATASIFIIKNSLRILDVIVLGEYHAKSLGVNYSSYLNLWLVIIAILTAISTSLIGLTAFIGIFISNLTYSLTNSAKHKHILPLASLLTILIFMITELLVEHFFNYKITVNILVNLVCGTYFFLILLFKKNHV